MFQHTAARRRLPGGRHGNLIYASFNTQPPGGGCLGVILLVQALVSFNTQPPGGGCDRRD